MSAINISRWVAQTGHALEDATAAINLMVLKGVIIKTPVDTGETKSSIHASIGAPSSDMETGEDDDEQAIARNMTVVNQSGGKVFYVTSNVPWIRGFEYGSSRQAPNGMFRLAVKEVADALL